MALLTAKLGPGGFHYLLPVEEDESDADDDSDADNPSVHEHLHEYFAGLGRENDRHILGGMCAAVALRPPDIEPEELIPLLWNGKPPASWNVDDAEELGDLISGLWNETEDRLDLTDEDEPKLIPSFADDPWEDDAELRDRARGWCRGFMRAVRAWPDEWNAVFGRVELQRQFGAIVATAEESRATTLENPIPADELPAEIGAALLAIRAAFPPDGDD
jgi:yecA family protein